MRVLRRNGHADDKNRDHVEPDDPVEHSLDCLGDVAAGALCFRCGDSYKLHTSKTKGCDDDGVDHTQELVEIGTSGLETCASERTRAFPVLSSIFNIV